MFNTCTIITIIIIILLYIADKPKLTELQLLEGHGGRKVRLVESVAYKWKELAKELDFNDQRIYSIGAGANSKHEKACQQMLEEWIGRDDDLKGPVTWTTLIQCLMDAGLMDIADRLKEIIYKS